MLQPFLAIIRYIKSQILRGKNNCNSKFQVREYRKTVAIIPFSKYFVT